MEHGVVERLLLILCTIFIFVYILYFYQNKDNSKQVDA